MTFQELRLLPQLTRAVEEMGYTTPSPIQVQAIPPALAGRDLIGCAQTGTGKTAAFAIPILQRLQRRIPRGSRSIRALVLTPTRELALQIKENFDLYGKYLSFRCAVIFGGVGQAPQVEALRQGVDVLVATPGRLNDLCSQGHINLSHVEIFVLDEADRMLDMGFIHDVRKIAVQLPAKRQTLLFSATIPSEIAELSQNILTNPVRVEVTPQATPVEAIEQRVYKVDRHNKKHLLRHILQNPALDSVLVFTNTKHGADRVVRELERNGLPAMAIHGNKGQTARVKALESFKNGSVRILVATDIAARGIDVSELSCVVNYELPNVPETYVHRIGRTGRAGRGGLAVSFCDSSELPYLREIEKLTSQKIPETEGHPWPMERLDPVPPAPRPARPRHTGSSCRPAPGKREPARGVVPVREPSRVSQAVQEPFAFKGPIFQPEPVPPPPVSTLPPIPSGKPVPARQFLRQYAASSPTPKSAITKGRRPACNGSKPPQESPSHVSAARRRPRGKG